VSYEVATYYIVGLVVVWASLVTCKVIHLAYKW